MVGFPGYKLAGAVAKPAERQLPLADSLFRHAARRSPLPNHSLGLLVVGNGESELPKAQRGLRNRLHDAPVAAVPTGEFARPFLIHQRSSIRRSAAMTSVVLERIVDGIAIAVLLRVLLCFVTEQSDTVRFARWGANVMFAIFAGGLAFLLFALWHQRRAVELVRKSVGRFAPHLADKAAE